MFFFLIKLTGGVLWKFDQPYLFVSGMVNFSQLTYIPKFKIINSTAAVVGVWILDFAKYQYLFRQGVVKELKSISFLWKNDQSHVIVFWAGQFFKNNTVSVTFSSWSTPTIPYRSWAEVVVMPCRRGFADQVERKPAELVESPGLYQVSDVETRLVPPQCELRHFCPITTPTGSSLKTS